MAYFRALSEELPTLTLPASLSPGLDFLAGEAS